MGGGGDPDERVGAGADEQFQINILQPTLHIQDNTSNNNHIVHSILYTIIYSQYHNIYIYIFNCAIRLTILYIQYQYYISLYLLSVYIYIYIYIYTSYQYILLLLLFI